MSATITGDNFGKAKSKVRGALRQAEQQAAEVGRDMAISICPVGEGQYGTHLFQTIRVEPQPSSHDVVAGDPGRNVRHTGWVEFGTERMAAQPFMSPTVPFIKAAFIGAIQRNVRGALR